MKRYKEGCYKEVPVTKTITIRLRVRTTEFEVLADALGEEVRASALNRHGCDDARITRCAVNGRAVKYGRRNRNWRNGN